MKTDYSLVLLIALFFFSCNSEKVEYVCTPCDLSCDDLTFFQAGMCPHCKMALIPKRELDPENQAAILEIDIQTGSGHFLMEGGKGHEDDTLKVFYHKPKNFSPDSQVLLVIPGAGRNGDSYRDAWIPESEQYSLLILSPMYPEQDYGFEDYHLCGLIADSNLKDHIEYLDQTNIAQLNEEQFQFTLNPQSDEWIFKDFDRIFDLATETLHSNQQTYDMFGHSAGGHILHRLALFHPDSKADRILASNPSFYTLPSLDYPFPFGLQDAPITPETMQRTFSNKLVVFLGELDNEDETGGTFLRSTTADKQGLHRLARGKYFFDLAAATAEEAHYEFNWKRVVVPGVGHNHRLMGDAAGVYLYGKTQ